MYLALLILLVAAVVLAYLGGIALAESVEGLLSDPRTALYQALQAAIFWAAAGYVSVFLFGLVEVNLGGL